MGLLDKFKSLITKSENTENTNIVSLTNITKSGLSVHPDLIDLIWIGDGKYKNYSRNSTHFPSLKSVLFSEKRSQNRTSPSIYFYY